MERRHVNEIREIIYRLRRGEKVRQVARDLHFSRNTIKKYRDIAAGEGWLNPAVELPDIATLGAVLGPPPVPRQMRSTVEPYAEYVKEQLEAEVPLAEIWRRLRRHYGYKGGYSSVRRYVARVHPPEPEVFCRIETAPGEEAQVDFGFAGYLWDAERGARRKVWAFVMTLSWSRHMYVEFVHDQTVSTWVSCHEHAFAWFHGSPRRLVMDNLKAVVLQAKLHDPVLGEPYRRLAQHYGFIIAPNRRRTPRHKGKVESGVKYVKRSFVQGQTFADLAGMNRQVQEWLIEEAGIRDHGTTHQAPLARFREVEQDTLQALPSEEFDLVSTHRGKVQRDCHVTVDGRYYSAPERLVGQQVEVYVGRRIVEIYHGTELVTTHEVLPRKGQRATRLEHYPAGKRAYLENPPERCRERAAAIGEACAQVVDGLLEDPVQERLRSVHALLRLGEKHGRARLEAACARALHYGDATYQRIKRILAARLDEQPLPDRPPVVAPLAQAYQFARPAAAFFSEEVTA